MPGDGHGRGQGRFQSMSWGLKRKGFQQAGWGTRQYRQWVPQGQSLEVVFGASCWLSIKFCMFLTFSILPKATNPFLPPFASPQHSRHLCQLAGFPFSPHQHLSVFFHLLLTDLRDDMQGNHKSSPPANIFEQNPLFPGPAPSSMSMISSNSGLSDFWAFSCPFLSS